LTSVRLNFDGLPNFERAVAAGLSAGLDAASQVIAGEMKRGFSKTARGVASAPGTPPGVQRGGLRNSIAVAKSGALSRRVGTNQPYGRIQEFGGTIRAKKGSLLVPIGPLGRRLAETGTDVRSMDLSVIRRPGRPSLLVQLHTARRGNVKGKGNGRAAMTPLFVLLKQVTLPARPWANPALNRAKPKMRDAFNRYAKIRIYQSLGVAS